MKDSCIVRVAVETWTHIEEYYQSKSVKQYINDRNDMYLRELREEFEYWAKVSLIYTAESPMSFTRHLIFDVDFGDKMTLNRFKLKEPRSYKRLMLANSEYEMITQELERDMEMTQTIRMGTTHPYEARIYVKVPPRAYTSESYQ